MARASKRLVVVSNRGPYRNVTTSGVRRRVRAAGGLVAALDPVLRGRKGVWISAGEAEDSHVQQTTTGEEDLEYELRSVELTRPQREGFYQGVSNAMLWPVLHSMPPTVRIAQAPWKNYQSANQAFCDSVLRASKPSDLIWVQDFHLMLLPSLLRARRKSARIGWFCHIPWPGDDLFRILPWHREILEGLLGADLLGFHTETYAHNFLGCVSRLLRCEVDFSRMTVRTGTRTVRIRVAPIGVPLDEIQTLASDTSVTEQVEKIRQSVQGRRILLGVDRLDYTKGIPQRLHAFEQLLKTDRSARNRYVLVQIMVPSREDVKAYSDLKTEIDRLVGDINGRYSSVGRVPIQYFYRNFPPAKLYAHYRAADVALVTPLRDGMNLVAMEYAACRIHGGGALVLSEFAGAVNYLEGAITVNPYDIQSLSQTMRQALAMTADEARPRMHSLRQAVHKLDVHRWADDYLEQLERGQ